MHGRDVSKEDEARVREIIRSIDKKLEYSLHDGRETGGPDFTLHLARQSWEGNIVLSIDDLKAAKSDLICRNKIRQKIKRLRDHMWDNRFSKDILGTKAAKMLKASAQREEELKRQFGRRAPRR